VNAEANPPDTVQQMFQSAGVIQGASADGRVNFVLTPENADAAGAFYFDVEATDGDGKTRTLDKGQFILLQDITKSAPGQVWIPSDGENLSSIEIDGSEFWLGEDSGGNFMFRRTSVLYNGEPVTVALTTHSPLFGSAQTRLSTLGDTSGLHGIGPTGIYRFEILVKWDTLGTPSLALRDWVEMGDAPTGAGAIFAFAGTWCALSVDAYVVDPNVGGFFESDSIAKVSLDDVSDWIRCAFQIDFYTRVIKAKVWNDAGAEPDWQVATTGETIDTLGAFVPTMMPAQESGDVLWIREFSWEQVG
jgi:hypothetical protein